MNVDARFSGPVASPAWDVGRLLHLPAWGRQRYHALPVPGVESYLWHQRATGVTFSAPANAHQPYREDAVGSISSALQFLHGASAVRSSMSLKPESPPSGGLSLMSVLWLHFLRRVLKCVSSSQSCLHPGFHGLLAVHRTPCLRLFLLEVHKDASAKQANMVPRCRENRKVT